MSNQRFSPEFKDEAVRQIVDRGYSVAEVSERLGVSAHSLYKWVKAFPYRLARMSSMTKAAAHNINPITSEMMLVFSSVGE